MHIRDNVWYSYGAPTDLACPPSGTLVRAEYANGDMLAVEFVPDLDAAGLTRRYPGAHLTLDPGERIAAAEVTMTVGGTDLAFGPRETKLGGGKMRDCVMVGCAVGIDIG